MADLKTFAPTASANDNTADVTKQIQEFEKKSKIVILVGFPSGRNHVPAKRVDDEGNPVVGETIETCELAKQLSFGAHGIPARPFLEDGLKEIQSKIRGAMLQELEKLKKGGSPNWDKIGTMAVGGIQEFVRGDYYKSTVPNSPATIEAKGSDTPLIDTADLINSLTYIVDKK